MYNTGKWQECLRILDGNVVLFASGNLPIELRRMKISCEYRLGLIQRATHEAESLAAESRDLSDKKTLITLKLASGDTKGAALIARDFLSRKEASAADLLQAAGLLELEDPPLARTFLEAAVRSGDRSPEVLGNALNLSFRLNQEAVFSSISSAVAAAAREGSGGFQAVSLQQMVEMVQASRHHEVEVVKQYRLGQIPLHFTVQQLGSSVSIAALIHAGFFPRSSTTAFSQHPIFIQSGGRIGTRPLSISRLYADLTSLLLAFDLGILEAVENRLAPIFIPNNLVQLLLDEIRRSMHIQPSRLQSAKRINALIADGKAAIIESSPSTGGDESLKEILGDLSHSLYKRAQQDGGFVLDFMPLRRGLNMELVSLNQDIAKRFIGFGTIINSLSSYGKLTLEENAFAQEHLKASIHEETCTEIPLGGSLCMSLTAAESLASANLLPAVAKCFHICLEASDAASITAELAQEDWQDGLRTKLRELVEHLRVGLERGTYHILPAYPIADTRSQLFGYNPTELSIVQLLVAENHPGAYTWIDDRFLNSFATCGIVPIVTTFEILAELRREGVLTEKDYFRKLNLLRAGNFRYMPFVDGEIVHHLRNAPIKEGCIQETPELATLRKYAAACILDHDTLRLSPQPGAPHQLQPEVELLLNLFRSPSEALLAIWRREDPDFDFKIAVAQSDWILEKLWFDVGSLPKLKGIEGPRRYGLSVAHLIIQGITLQGRLVWKRSDRQAPRILYFAWLDSRFGRDPLFLKSVGQHISMALELDKLLARRSEVDRRFGYYMLGTFYDDLPRSLKRFVGIRRSTLRRMGIRQGLTVELSKWKFGAVSLWRAADRAIRKGEARVIAKETAEAFSVRVRKGCEHIILDFASKNGTDGFSLSDPVLDLAIRDRASISKTLASNRDWFDRPNTSFQGRSRYIAGIDNITERLLQVHFEREKSPSARFTKIEEILRSGKALPLKEIEPPPLVRLLGHLRLELADEPEDFPIRLERAANELVREVGFVEAFGRVSSLPVSLPNCILEAYDRLSASEQATWKKAALTGLPSPISQIHTVALLARNGSHSALGKDGDDALHSFFDPETEKSFGTFRSILTWTLAEIEAQPRANALHIVDLLAAAWIHAVRLHNTLSHFDRGQTIRNYFQTLFQPPLHQAFEDREKIAGDVAHPRQCTLSRLLVHGLGTIAGNPATQSSLMSIRTSIRKVAFADQNGSSVPRLELSRVPNAFHNHLGSFLGNNTSDSLHPLLEQDEAALFDEHLILMAAEGLIANLINDSGQESDWSLFAAFTGLGVLPERLRNQSYALLVKTQVSDISGFSLDALRLVLFWMATQARFSGESDLVQKVTTDLASLARQFARTRSSFEKDRVETVVEAAHILTLGQGDAASAAGRFGDLIGRVINDWPSAADFVEPIVARLVIGMPPEIASELWPLLLRLRKLKS
jgi:hypothetical protein